MTGRYPPLSEGEAIVEGTIRVAARGRLRRVFAVADRWFAEIEAWPDGSGLFIAPLRATVLEPIGAAPPGADLTRG